MTDAGNEATPWGADDLTVRFGARTALAGVCVSLPPGAVTAVVGGDGAGKSTLLRALVGVVAPDAGQVRRPPREQLGYLAGGAGVYPDLTVDENLDFVATAYRQHGSRYERRRAELLDRTKLAGARDRLGGRLSGGMRQKLAVAMALLHEPVLVVLDEPTTGVDPVSRTELARLVAHAAAGGAAVVLTTTYLDEAERAASVLVLESGRPLVSGRPRDVVVSMPGAVWAVPGRPRGQLSWRRGEWWHLWTRDGVRPAGPGLDGARPADVDLEDAVVVAALAAAASPLAVATPAARGEGATEDGDDNPRTAMTQPGPHPALPAEAPLPASARGVVRRFGAFTAVGGVDIAVRPGEVVGLLGANGAGKTTLIRILLGLLPATAGLVELFGAPPSRATRHRIGYVPQGLGLYDDLTVRENLEFSARAFGVGSIDGCFADPDVAAAAGEVVAALPLGLRRRTAFAAALAHSPDLLVLDEPTSGVDPLGRARLWDTIRDAAESGAGVLVSTHYMEEAENCDRLVVMAAGAVVASGGLHDIVAGRVAVEVRSGAWEPAFVAIEDAGLAVSLHGERVRVVGSGTEHVAAVLRDAGVSAQVSPVPVTFEEAFVLLATGGGAA